MIEQKEDNQQVSPSNANVPVSCSLLLKANVPKRFAEAVKELHKKYQVEIKEFKEYKNHWITVVVEGSKDNLEKLNRECEIMAYDLI